MNPFLRQPQAFRRTPVRAQVEARDAGDGVVSLRLYDPIDSWGGFWGVSAREFAETLDELPDDTSEIRLLINSPGGEVWEGLAIVNLLRSHDARVVAVVEGVAASAASFVAAAADELQIWRNAELFVHRAWNYQVGHTEDMRWMADSLAHDDRNIASIYQAKAGGDIESWLSVMAEDRTYSAEEAVEAGLADRVLEPPGGDDAKARAHARFDLEQLKRANRTPQNRPAPPGPSRTRGTPVGVEITEEQLQELRKKAGVDDDADLETTLQALPDPAPADPVDPPADPAPVTPTVVPADSTVTVDAATWEQTRADATAGREARREQQQARREQLVDAAVNDGRIASGRRQHWIDALKADPGAEQTLAALQKGLIPVDRELGHDHDVSGAGANAATTVDAVKETDVYKNWSM